MSSSEPAAPTVTCIVQARMGSSRLPGKVVADLGGRPMLAFQLARLRDLHVDHLVVATSELPGDDEVERVARAAGVEVVRGSEPDVLGRFALALDRFPADTVVRLTGDCPLSDPAIIRAAIGLHHSLGADYTANVFPRTFPKGLDVEVARSDALLTADREARSGLEREHVTPFLYRHPERFRLANLRSGMALGEERWTVDTGEDLADLRQIVERMGGDGRFSWTEALEVVGARFRPAPGTVFLRPAEMHDADELLRWRNDPVTVANSHTPAPVDEVDHLAWLRTRLADPPTRLLIAQLDGTPIGQLRLDIEDATAVVSITVAPEVRGLGHGTAMLRALQGSLAGDVQIDRLVAEVAPGNEASRRAFLATSFSPTAPAAGFDRFEWENRRQ